MKRIKFWQIKSIYYQVFELYLVVDSHFIYLYLLFYDNDFFTLAFLFTFFDEFLDIL